jgi:hypothetical protein
LIDNNGLSIEIEGFDEGFGPAMKPRVSLEQQLPGLQTVTVLETGETWRLCVKKLINGIIILGISPPEDITN